MKLFRGGPPTSARIVDDLKLVLRLEPSKRSEFAKWFEDIPNLYPMTFTEIIPFANELQLDPQELSRLMGLVRFVLNSCASFDLSEADLRSDFVEAGLADSEVESLIAFFQSMMGSQDKVHRAVLRRAYEQLALPTIDDVNLVWDIRPIFEDVAYTVNPKGEDYESLMGKVYVLLLEISASRSDGQRESKTFQLSEEEFERLSLAMQRVRRQLEIVKQKVM